MFRRKKSQATKILAIFLAILLIAYNVPIGISSTGFAQNEAFTLQILNNGVPVANKEVSAHNDQNEVSVTGTTDSNGVVPFPELTKATFGQNNQFQFTVDGNTFSRVLTEGTTENVIYDLSTKTFQHTVTVNKTGSGTVKVNGADYTGPVKVNEKSDVSINITPDTGYEIKSVTIGGKSETVSDKENYSGTIADISTDTTVDVQFILKTYTITFNSDPQGTIQDGANQTIDNKGGTVTVQDGADSSFTVIPNTGYHVATIKIDRNPIDLSKDVTPVQNGFQYTFKNVTSNHSVEVSFAMNTYEVSAKVNGGNGTVSPTQTVVDYGGEVQLTMTPANNSYQVSSITINGTDVPNLANDSDFVENDDGSFTYTVKNITSDTSIQVSFAGVPLLDHHWDQYVSFTPTSGSLARSYTEGKNDILVFSKDAVVELSAKAPYNQLDMNLSGWQDKVTLSSETTINRLLVRTKSGKNRQEVNLNGGTIMVVFDKNAPTAKITAAPKDNKVTTYHDSTFSGDATFHVDVQDPESGVNKVEIDVNGQKFKEYDFSNEKNVNPAIDSFSTSDFSTIPINSDGSYVVKVTAVDNAGNQMPNPAEKTIYIDKAAPSLDNSNGKAVTFETKNDNLMAKLLNFLSFGTFFNKEITVTVKATDAASQGGTSGVKMISLGTSDPNVVPEEVNNSFQTNGNTAEAKFTINVDHFKGTLNAKVTDNVNNSQTYSITNDNSNLTGNGEVMIEKNPPSVKVDVVPDANVNTYQNLYYSGNVSLHVQVQDDESGVNMVNRDLNGKKFEDDYSDQTEKQTKVNYSMNTGDPGIPMNRDGSYVLSVQSVDNGGNELAKPLERTVILDTQAPTLDNSNGKAVTFETKNDSTFARVLNFLSFGTFFNKQMDVTVKATDDAAIGGASGVQSISLKTSDPKVVPQEVAKSFTSNGKTAEAKFTLDVDSFRGTFNVELTDNVNNKRTMAVTSGNSNITGDSAIVLIEKNKPSSTVTVSTKDGSHAYVDEAQHEFYNEDVTYHVEVNDQDSGVNAVALDVNGKNMTDQPYYYDDKGKATYQTDNILPVPTKDATIKDDGSYVLTVHEIDNAGNENTESKTVYIDRTSPKITNFAFSSDDGKQGDPTLQKDIKDSVEPTDYGFFFKKPTKVTVTAEDPTVKSEATSKVQSETIYLKDYENGKYYAVGEGGKLIGITRADVDKIAAVPTTRDVTFYVPENFKGQIFAKASDHVNNTSTYQSPMGAIVENEAQHAKSSSISLDKESTTFKDNNGLDLYAKNVPVNMKVADSYSGIAKVEWSVVAPYDTAQNQSGTAVIDQAKNVSGDAGWNTTKTDQNLVTEMTKTILVNNDSNNIVLHVKLTDQAGNTSEKELTFSIDKTAPKLEVTYDNNTPDSQYTDYYKEDRTATIVVSERNFRPEDVQYEITNKDGSVPTLVGWTTVENAQDPNQTTHIATVKYSSDGDYTFNMSYKDNAGNAAAPFHEQKFTLDKTIPVITVSYSNHSVSNGDYYKAARTATVQIKEHNFDPSRVKVEGTASDNGNTVGFPQMSGWSTNGDMHTATIHYGADAKYSFDIDFMDKAGNRSADYKPDQFVVDQTAPALTISGVKDKSANNGDVIPVISYSDTNFNQNGVSIKLSGANRGNVTPEGSFAEAPNGQVFTFKNFAKDKKVDDIYTLTANLTDFAGNQTTQTIQFSVNRFGSVYVFDDSLKKIEGKYVKHPKDVVVTETNVDTLKPETVKVKMTKNGTPTDLTAGKDYTLTHEGGDGKWSQYKYVVKKGLFAGDGKYLVSLYSEDAAGNINENIDESKKAEISFGIDQTAPVVIPVDFESGKQYPVDKKSVSVSIKDNLVLKGAKIYLNGKKVAQKVDGENYTFTIPSSNSKQNVKIVAVDAAGNEHVKNVNDFLVSTNPFVRWYNNTPLLMGSIGGVGVAGSAAIYLVARKMRKEEEDD